MSANSDPCTCSIEGYSADCPHAFYQGGKMLHSIEAETKLKPRLYLPQSDASKIDDSEISNNQVEGSRVKALTGIGRGTEASQDPKWSKSKADSYNDYLEHMKRQGEEEVASLTDLGRIDQQLVPRALQTNHQLTRPMVTKPSSYEERMMESQRTSLRKFESLSIGGQDLVGMSIGGYSVDIGKAAEKARSVVPLPPAKLPIIFVEDELNFYHHFFQGIEILLGNDVLEIIITTDKYYDDGDLLLMPMIEEMLTSGHEKSDSEITVFTKRVLCSTFETMDTNAQSMSDKNLVVAANLWGFQYIESGMRCREADLKMWLSINYSQYKTMWFNTFKSAGVPAFARHGVQTRYSRADSAVVSGGGLRFDPNPSVEHEIPLKQARSGARRESSGRKVHRHRRRADEGY